MTDTKGRTKIGEVSELVDAWFGKKRKLLYAHKKCNASNIGGKGSINKLIQTSKSVVRARASKRQKTYAAPMAASIIPKADFSNDISHSPRTVQAIVFDSSTKIRLMKEHHSDADWLRLVVRQHHKLNDKLTLLKTDHPKFSTVILQGLCSSNVHHVLCHDVSFFSLYRGVFWCLNWKLG